MLVGKRLKYSRHSQQARKKLVKKEWAIRLQKPIPISNYLLSCPIIILGH